MEYITHSHRHAEAIINADDALKKRYQEFIKVLESITEEDLINDFNFRKQEHNKKKTNFKSISHSINGLLKEKISKIDGWNSEVDIFNDNEDKIKNTEWRLDFACENGFAVEIAFNHGEAIAWNLIKPCLSSELNHVQKALQTKIGIYVCATEEMKKAGNFDNASGSFEKVVRYLPPMMNQLTTPIMILGLLKPKTFRVDKDTKEIVHL